MEEKEIVQFWISISRETLGYKFSEGDLKDWNARFLRNFLERCPHTEKETLEAWKQFVSLCVGEREKNKIRWEGITFPSKPHSVERNRDDGTPEMFGRDRD